MRAPRQSLGRPGGRPYIGATDGTSTPWRLVRALLGFLLLLAILSAAPLMAQDPTEPDTVQVLPPDHPLRPQPPPRPDLSVAERVVGGIGSLLRAPFEFVGTAVEGTLIPIEEERGGFATGLSATETVEDKSRFEYTAGSIGTRSGFLGAGVKLNALTEWEGPQLGATAAATNRGYQTYTAFAGWNDPEVLPYARVTGYYDLDTMNEYWGIGPDTVDDDESGFSWEKFGATAVAGLPEDRMFWGRAWVSYERTTVFDGYSVTEPDISEVFPSDVFPELELWGPGATVAIDLRDSPGYPRSGAMLQGTAQLWRSLGDDDAKWFRYGGEASGHLPLGSDWHILSVKAGVDVAESDEENGFIPFPYLPALGGSQSLRGFGSWRFRDRAAVYGTAEFRWRIWHEHTRDPDRGGALEAALFYDVGRVAPELGDIELSDLESTEGLLIRFYLPAGHFITLGVGHSNEETRFLLSTNNTW